MGDLHIAGFEIPVARQGGEASSGQAGGVMRAIDGSPGGGVFHDVEDGTFQTPQMPLSTANAIRDLCRGANGSRWGCDNSVWSSSGLSMTDTPTFQSGTVKFGTHAISIAGAAGDVSIATVVTANVTKYTLAAWTKDGAGAWQHQILRSDGAKWVDGTRNDAATLIHSVAANVWTLEDHASNTRYFDELVWLPFEIADSWGADWPQAEVFSDLPDLQVWGDLFGAHEFTARARARVRHLGQASYGDSASVAIQIVGGQRGARA